MAVLCASAQAQYGGGSGEPNDPYLIATAEQMNAIGANPNDWDKHFKLIADLDLAAYAGTQFNLVGLAGDFTRSCGGVAESSPTCFSGIFDGNGHIISDFTYTGEGESSIALFRCVCGPNAEVRNLGLVAPKVDGRYGGDVGALVGTIIGGGWGDGWARVIDCYSMCDVFGTSSVGGLVGSSEDLIADCYSTSTVTGEEMVGGLVGSNGAMIGCYATGFVMGSDSGGLVGAGEGGAVASFWGVETSGKTVSAGGTGLTTAEMTTAAPFLEAGWDFVDETENGTDDIWWILEGQDTPRLWWERDAEAPL